MTVKSERAQPENPARRGRGFSTVSGVLQTRIRKAAETRGFAISRLLTHWEAVAGPELSRLSHPVKVGYPRQCKGATLTLLCRGAHAPLVQAQLPLLREKVNACYGYNAISRILITQTHSAGFTEDDWEAPKAAPEKPVIDPKLKKRAASSVSEVRDDGLKDALERLGHSILARAELEKENST